MKRLRVRIRGTVQGVGFRYWVKQTARGLGINGWVKNVSDGSVEAVFEGNEVLLKKMINECQQGPPLAKVEAVEIEEEEKEGLKGFEVTKDSLEFASLKN